MNAQAAYLWFERLGVALHSRLGLQCSVESRPIHLSVALHNDAWFAIGDANGPVGFDIGKSDGWGGDLTTAWDSKSYVGDDVEALADELANRMLKVLFEHTDDVIDEVDGDLTLCAFGAVIAMRGRYCACRGFVPVSAGPCTSKDCGSYDDGSVAAVHAYCAACNEPIAAADVQATGSDGLLYHDKAGCFRPMLCEGHEPEPGTNQPQGETFYCDGSCGGVRRVGGAK